MCVCVCVCVCVCARNRSTSPELVFTLLMTCFAVLRSFPTSDDIVITAYEGGFATIPCTAPYSHPPATIVVQTSTGRPLSEAQGKAAVPLDTSLCCGFLLSLFGFCLFAFLFGGPSVFSLVVCTCVSSRLPVLTFSTMSGFASLGVFHAGFASIGVFHALWFCQSWRFSLCLVLPVLAFSAFPLADCVLFVFVVVFVVVVVSSFPLLLVICCCCFNRFCLCLRVFHIITVSYSGFA